MESIDELAMKLKVDAGRWEEEIFKWACSLAQCLAKAVLEEIDDELMKERDKSLQVEALEWHRIITVFGDVRIKQSDSRWQWSVLGEGWCPVSRCYLPVR